MQITLVQGDITRQQVDVIVNAANSSLLGGGGVDGAIHRNGGPEILAACRGLRAGAYPDGLPAGQAAATTAGRLPATWVIHTVGPVYSPREDRSALLAGQAAATTAGRLPATWVIHTVGPVYSPREDRSALLASCYTSSLRVAAELGGRTIAFPAVSAGIYGWPPDAAARIAVTTVHTATEHPTLTEARFVLFTPDMYHQFQDALAALTG